MADLQDGQTKELPEMHATSAGLKALCTFEGAAGLEECRKCCGGHGVLLASGVSQMALDYTTYCTAEGDRIILELQSARYLMKMTEEARKGIEIFGMASYLNQISKSGKDDVDSLLHCHAGTADEFQSLEVLSHLFKNRALVWCIETAARLDELGKAGQSFDEAWNLCSVDLVKCSRVHCYHVILQNFVAAIDDIEDKDVKAVLTRLCVLFGLINIDEDLGSFNLNRNQKSQIRNAIRRLLEKIRIDCVPLVDAFEFPVSSQS